jgi:hypothetical protein
MELCIAVSIADLEKRGTGMNLRPKHKTIFSNGDRVYDDKLKISTLVTAGEYLAKVSL